MNGQRQTYTMRNSNTDPTFDDPVSAGREALARGTWGEARACFEAALRVAETAEALEGLGIAAWWQDDATVTFDARERAYRLYRQREDFQGAARMATNLAYDYYSFRGEYAIASGWLQRAHRLLEGLDLVPEQGLLAIFEGYFALMLNHDTAKARRLGEQAAQIGDRLKVIDIEMLALALEGLARVCAGDIAEGMRCLDESTTAAVSGEMTDPDACATACCYLIYACERVRDYNRAAQWCAYVKVITTRWKYPLLFSYCRVHYASVLIWRGDWAEAEATLVMATNELVATRPAEAVEGIMRLADLRRRQGRFDETATLLAQGETHPFRMLGGNLALLGRAALALDQGDPAGAVDMAERFLRGLPAEDHTERPAALELLVLAQTARGDRAQAQTALTELNAIASAVATEPFLATARFAAGLVAAADGEYEAAFHHFEDAVDLYHRNGALFEVARARIQLARSLLALGRNQAAERQAGEAIETFQQLGAVPEGTRAAALLHEIESTPQASSDKTSDVAGLTPRELDVLRLIAAGKSNQEIAAELVLSVRTVERHISNIYEKVGASGAVARATATAFALRHGLTQPHMP
ncbi:MAG: LuxR C-terminal-related transcriptional regulator [Anaerolineales bacterium]